MYPNDNVQAFLNGSFVAAKVNIEEGAELARRFSVTWTPTLLFLDGNEVVHYRIVPGSLPADEFIPAVKVGLGKIFFDTQKYDQAIQVFDEIASKHARTLAVPQALYWRGVSYYKKGDKSKLVDSWKAIQRDHAATHWAKAVSFLK